MTVKNVLKPTSIGIQSVEIGFRILEAFIDEPSALSLKQVSDVCKMAPSKVHRYLVSFVRVGVLVQLNPNGLYDLGPTARRLGIVSMERMDAFAIASNKILKLRDETGHTVLLSVWSDSGPVVVRWEDGTNPLPVSVRIGSTMPLVGSAIGTYFLAHMPKAVTGPVRKRQTQTLGERYPKMLSVAYLEEIRRTDSLHLSSALLPGIDAISAPVFNGQNKLALVICLVAPAKSMQGAAGKKMSMAVAAVGKQISAELGSTRK
jgi:DNA-binding IclR family transcriptional regulator